MTGVSTVSDDVLSLVEPGSAADRYTRCELTSDRARGVPFFPYNEVPAGYQFAVGTVYSTFSLGNGGLIDQFQVDNRPVDQLVVPGDGAVHATDDKTVTATVICFEDETIGGGGGNAPDTGILLAVVNSGPRSATLGPFKYEAGGQTFQASPVSRPISAGQHVTTIVLVPSAPRGGTLKVTIATTDGKTTFDVAEPSFGPR